MLLRCVLERSARAACKVLPTSRRLSSVAGRKQWRSQSTPGLSSQLRLHPACAEGQRTALNHVGVRKYSSKGKKSSARPEVSLNNNNEVVVQHLGKSVAISPRYLLDHCRCPKCFHTQTKQRLKCLADFDPSTGIRSFSETPDGIEITWELEDHVSVFPWTFWSRLVSSSTWQPSKRILWGAKITDKPPSVAYEQLTAPSNGAEQGALDCLEKVDEYGFCFVHDVPASPDATEELIKRIGPIRQTHYGGFWDFTADMSLGDLAYSSQSLPAHTDTSYFSDPCGLQIFHLLSHPPPGEGGTTLLVDGFNVALQLEREQPGMFQTLSTVPVPHHASGNPGLAYRTFRPVISLQANDEVEMIRWNNEDRGVLVPQDRWDGENAVEMWYTAAREFESILRRKENEYWVQLKPGTVCIIDNWRVLHGRSAFTGSRRMCGAYVGRDDWRSRLWTLKRQFDNQPKDEVWDYGW